MNVYVYAINFPLKDEERKLSLCSPVDQVGFIYYPAVIDLFILRPKEAVCLGV